MELTVIIDNIIKLLNREDTDIASWSSYTYDLAIYKVTFNNISAIEKQSYIFNKSVKVN